MHYFWSALLGAWGLFIDSAVYVLFGLLLGGMLKVFLDPALVARHLGRGKFWPVIKAAAVGVPLPLCCCGVLPAAAALKKQGANNGATTAFVISTPESGVDSMAVTYALMDPLMTLARPVAGMLTAVAAGVAENLLGGVKPGGGPELPLAGDCAPGCAGPGSAPPAGLGAKLLAGLNYARGELWRDLAPLFFLGLLLAGAVTSLVPEGAIEKWLGGGLPSMLIMLVAGVPIYICATASTPIAAALIIKGVSPGAALVFLLAGPATNLTTITVLSGLLGKRATAVYLACLSLGAVACGLLLDQVYAGLGISARAAAGQAAELMPGWLSWAGVIILLGFSVGPLWDLLRHGRPHSHPEQGSTGTR